MDNLNSFPKHISFYTEPLFQKLKRLEKQRKQENLALLKKLVCSLHNTKHRVGGNRVEN